MKATELMLGDRVYCYHPSRPRKVVTVDADLLGLMERIESGLVTEESPLYRIIEPIPLTPEILEKNGFKKQGFDGWEIDHKTDDGNDLEWFALWRNDYSSPHLQINSFMSLYGSFSSFEIHFVHQLQHALRLCGIEKEIVL